ncbi:MAG: Gfo/Idh/MocA family oxidoreductase [Candidatus Accumulibacter sp.]|nr:Gfo/Idh/MocA family oxidoreductase [Accumulibacter sp.]
MERKVRFGIIGAGMIANFHAQAIGAVGDAQLTAVCDSDASRADEFAGKHGIAAWTDLDAFLAQAPIDAVTIATPTGLHGDVAIPAARAGKHILCEKPLDTTPEKARAIVDACRENRVILAPVFQNRFGVGAMGIKRAIDAGRFGRLLFVSGHIKWWRSQAYYDSGAWRGTWALDGGGCLMNQSIHTIDLMIHFAGAPERVFGYTATRTHQIEVEDNACAAVHFRNGALGVIEASTSCAPGFPLRIEVAGERGSAAIEGDRIVAWNFADDDPGDAAILAGIDQGGSLGSGASDPKAISVEGHRLQIADLTRAILTESAPAIDGAEAILPVELICGIYASMKSGQAYSFKERT